MSRSLTKEYDRIIAFFSDLHVGAWTSIAPENRMKIGKEFTYDPSVRNKGQLVLADYWREAMSIVDECKVDTVCLLGDLIDGYSPKEKGPNFISSNLNIQYEMAVNILEPLCKDRVVHLTCGSGYHESKEWQVYDTLAHRLGRVAAKSTFHSVLGNIRMTPTDKVFNIAHVSTSAMLYTSTMLDREAVYMENAYGRGKLPRIHAFARGHLHRYGYLDNGFMQTVLVPCWKTWYPIAGRTNLYGRYQPDIGFVLAYIDTKGNITWEKYLWNAPHITDRLVDG